MKESDFKFLGFRISKIEFDIGDLFGQKPENINQDINIECNFNKEKPRFVEVVLNITVKSNTDNLYFFLKMKGGFQANEKMPENTFQLLARQNGPAILYPFARGIITSYTAQANITPIILPTVNFVAEQQTEKVKSSDS